MTEAHCALIAKELGVVEQQIRAVEELLAEGATVPFIARYRKETSGSLEEVAISTIRDRIAQLEELDKRRESILNSLEERELITEQLRKEILAAEAERARQSKRLATIATDVPVDFDFARCLVGGYERGKLLELFRELEFFSLLDKLLAHIGKSSRHTHNISLHTDLDDFGDIIGRDDS